MLQSCTALKKYLNPKNTGSLHIFLITTIKALQDLSFICKKSGHALSRCTRPVSPCVACGARTIQGFMRLKGLEPRFLEVTSKVLQGLYGECVGVFFKMPVCKGL